MTNDFLEHLPSFHRALLRWYKTHGRKDLPWRKTRDPYAIYISEIMLQQTQVKTVLERYYSPFLKRFPTLTALARADTQDVMKAWEGLGYYTRAGNLHKAAQHSKGALPQTVEALMALPGIGRNTASAVASFAFGVPVPVMEANVKRVLCRVFALKTADDKVLWERAGQLLDTKNVFDYNQAMMDVGALICTKRNPKCDICPLALICKGKKNPEAYPAAKIKKTVPTRKRLIVVFHDGKGGYYLMKRETRFLNGLYGFKEYDAGTRQIALMDTPYIVKASHKIGDVEQSYSHFTLEAEVYKMRIEAKDEKRNTHGLTKATLAEIGQLPLSRADLKIIKMLSDKKGDNFC